MSRCPSCHVNPASAEALFCELRGCPLSQSATGLADRGLQRAMANDGLIRIDVSHPQRAPFALEVRAGEFPLAGLTGADSIESQAKDEPRRAA